MSAAVKNENALQFIEEDEEEDEENGDEFDFSGFNWIAPRQHDEAAVENAVAVVAADAAAVAAADRHHQRRHQQAHTSIAVRQSNGAGSGAQRAASGFAPWARSNVSILIAKHKSARSRVEFNAAVRSEWRALDRDAQLAFARLSTRQQRAARHNRANSHALCK